MFTAISEGSLCAAIAMQKVRRQETVAMRVIETPRFGIVARISRFWRLRDQQTKSRSTVRKGLGRGNCAGRHVPKIIHQRVQTMSEILEPGGFPERPVHRHSQTPEQEMRLGVEDAQAELRLEDRQISVHIHRGGEA